MSNTNDASQWANLPFTPTSPVTPFTLTIPDKDVDNLHTLLTLSRLPAQTFESSLPITNNPFGVSHSWMANAISTWKDKTKYDWTARQTLINRHPQFKVPITDNDGTVYDIHFMALFSKRKNAVPVAMLHGWPGSFLEFLEILDLVSQRYTPETLPYHLIVPSLPGYTLSSGPRLTADFTIDDASQVIDKLMQALGFGDGYAVQGGDVGGIMAPIMAKTLPSVKAIHVNLIIQPKPEGFGFPELNEDPDLSEQDKFKKERAEQFMQTGYSYASMHGTRPATAGFAVGSNPISLLAWIGEKLLAWPDPRAPLPLELILDNISLYWFTDTMPRCLWPYRALASPETMALVDQQKPVGYSRFRFDADMAPRKWVEKMCNLVFFKDHADGGHFAAAERPEALWEDVEEFLRAVFKDRF